MRNFIELTEAKGQIVFAFGRFNPPTTGHEKLISKVAQLSGSNPYRIYPSFSQNPKKDPLPHALKVGYMRKMFSKHARNIVADKDAKTAIHVAVKLYDEGFTDLVMVAGSDRVKEFSSLLKTYNGVEGKRHGFYKFKTIDVVSAGERDPDAEGVEGMSASKMRAAAVEGDFNSFQQGVPKGFKDAKKLYNDVRKYMGIREERHMGEMDEHEAVRDAYLTGKIWNVGDIVEANGVSGKVIRKGTNYIAFHDEEGKVHKAWLHEIDLDEALPIQVTVKDKSGKTHTTSTRDLRGATHALLIHYKEIPAVKGNLPGSKESKPPKTDIHLGTEQKLAKQAKHLLKKHPAAKFAIGAEAIKLTQKMVKGATLGEELDLDERNYAKEYANYHGKPEQIARRSSRNKARRAMGDKVKTGMDVGHKDNDPLNNEPDNLRNEDPSKNRREPRLRGQEARANQETESLWDNIRKKKERIKKGSGEKMRKPGEKGAPTPAQIQRAQEDFELNEKIEALVKKAKNSKYSYATLKKVYDRGMGAYKTNPQSVRPNVTSPQQWALARVNSFIKGGHKQDDDLKEELSGAEKEKMKGYEKKIPKKDFIDKYGKEEGERIYYATITNMAKENAEEIEESPITGILRKVNQMTHPKQYDAIVKAYVKSRKDEPKKTTSFAIDKIVRQYSGIDVRSVIDYINKLIKKGVLPKDLAASYHSEEVVKEWYESETIRESYQEKYGDDWWWKLNEVHDKMLEKLGICCEDCLTEEHRTLSFTYFRKLNDWSEITEKAEHDGKSVNLNNPTKGDTKKYKVYVKNDKGNVVKVEFGDPNMEIIRDAPARRKSFRARHNCDNPGPKWKAKYWSCKFWSTKSVTDLMKG